MEPDLLSQGAPLKPEFQGLANHFGPATFICPTGAVDFPQEQSIYTKRYCLCHTYSIDFVLYFVNAQERGHLARSKAGWKPAFPVLAGRMSAA